MKCLLFSILFLFTFISTSFPQWTQSKGLWGAAVNSMITTDSSFLIISFGNQVHLCKDNEPGWQIKDGYGFEFLKQDTVLFTQNWDYLWRSMDGGLNWQELPDYFGDLSRTTKNALFTVSWENLYRSYDYGDSWENISEQAGLEDDLYHVESWENFLLVRTFEGDFLTLTFDDGETWILLPLNGLPFGGYFYVEKFCMQADEVWLSTNKGVYRLPESEDRWKPVDTASIKNSVIFFEFHDTLYIGSKEGCHYFDAVDSTWVPRNSGFRYKGIYSFTSWNDTLYSSSYPGIYRMDQNGSWSLWNSELSWHRIQNIYAYKNDVWVNSIWDNPYGPYGYQLFRSSDNGTNFTELDSNLVLSANELIMTDSLYYLDSKDGFFISQDFGDSWEPRNSGFDTLSIFSIAINRQHCFAGTPTGLYWSSNPPITWQPVPNFIGTFSTRYLAVHDSIIFCMVDYNDDTYAMMRSENSGVTFDPVCINTDCNLFYPFFREPNFYYFSDSVYYSTETGFDFKYVPTPWAISSPDFLEADQNCLVIAHNFFPFPINITYNMGINWIDIADGLSLPTSLYSDIHPEINEMRVFAGIEYTGLWYRDDLLTQISDDNRSEPDAIKIYPNPFSREFSIALHSKDSINGQLRIFDIQGRMIYQKELHDSTPVHISPNIIIVPGLYILQLRTAGRIYSSKLLRN